MAVVSLAGKDGWLVSPGGPRGKGGPPSDDSGQRAQSVRWREWRRTGPPLTCVLLDEELAPTFFGWLRGHLLPGTLITSSAPFHDTVGTHGAGQPAGVVTRNESSVAAVVRSPPRPEAPMATPAVRATRTHAATSRSARRRGLRVMRGSCSGSGRRAAVGWRRGRDIAGAGGRGRSGGDEDAVAAALERVAQPRRLAGGAALEDLEAVEERVRLDPPELGV